MSKKKKNRPEYGQYVCYSKCGKACKVIDLPHLDANYCPNCGYKLTDTKSTDVRIQSTQDFLKLPSNRNI